MQNIENIRIDEVLDELYGLREENESLKLDNDFLQRQNNALKIRCSDYCIRLNKAECEIKDMKFTRNFLTSEEAGARFARELLEMGEAHIDAEEKAIADGEAHYERTWNINGGDDY